MIRVPAALGLCLALGTSATIACAGDFWELRSGDITVMAESREVAAAETATRIVRLRSAVRWLAQWPDDFQPQPVLAFAIEDATFDRYFGRPEPRWGVLNGVGDDRGIALNTHAVNVLTFTISPRDGREFEQLVAAHGAVLVRPDRADEPHRLGSLGRWRQWIESTFDTLKDQLGLERHQGRTLAGVYVRVAQRLLALAATIWWNWQIGAPDKRSLLAYDH